MWGIDKFVTSGNNFVPNEYTISELALLTGLSEHALWQTIRSLGLTTTCTAGAVTISRHSAQRIFLDLAHKRAAGMAAAPATLPKKLCALMRAAIGATRLDLTDLAILTEAVRSSYCTTAVIGALAKARRVYAFAPTGFGSVGDIECTMELATRAGVADRILLIDEIRSDTLEDIDIVTNSETLRPIGADLIGRLPPRAVVALMSEPWRRRPQDIDMATCVHRGIPVVGVNERHRSVDVFSYFGPLCVKLLHDAGIAVYGNRIAVLCDNAFGPFIERSLAGLGANVSRFPTAEALEADDWDAVLIALRPAAEPRIDRPAAARIAACAPDDVIVAQLWGDIDRAALLAHGIPLWPPQSPKPGHLAVPLSDIGPNPVVRLQAGGLRAAEWVCRGRAVTPGGIAQLVELPDEKLGGGVQ